MLTLKVAAGELVYVGPGAVKVIESSAGRVTLGFEFPAETAIERSAARARRLRGEAQAADGTTSCPRPARRPAGERARASGMLAASPRRKPPQVYLHLYEEGVYCGYHKSASGGLLDRAEAERLGRRWMADKHTRGYLLSEHPDPAG